jgi:hypothetical protein
VTSLITPRRPVYVGLKSEPRAADGEEMSVDYTLLPVFTESRRRHEEARRALPERWRTDPRPEVQLINDLWVEVQARARQHLDELDNGSPSGPTVFLDDR